MTAKGITALEEEGSGVTIQNNPEVSVSQSGVAFTLKMSQHTPDKDNQTSGAKKTISLPISRVRLIMKSSPDVSSINQDALFLTTKATELFVQHLAQTSFTNSSRGETNTLDYSDLAKTAETIDTFHFLTDILPKKILARDYLKSLEQMQDEDADF